MQSVRWIIMVAMVFSIMGISEGCSCAPMHPQQHYCRADFVIRARVKKEFLQNDTIIYKVRINKQYKMTDKALVALKSGRLSTAAWDSLCGKRLDVGKVYIISGKIFALKASISLCNFNELWENVSKRQRKGFQRMYQQGCTHCNVKQCKSCAKKPKTFCFWKTWSPNDQLDCERMNGICLPLSNGDCTWVKNKMQRTCMINRAEKERNRLAMSRVKKPDMSRQKNSLTISR